MSKTKKEKHVPAFVETLSGFGLLTLILIGMASYASKIDKTFGTASEEKSVKQAAIFINSDIELISEEEADALSEEETRLAMAEIYARYGQVFTDDKITDHVKSAIPHYDILVNESNGTYYSICDLNTIEATNLKILESTYEGYQDPSLDAFDLTDEEILKSINEVYALK